MDHSGHSGNPGHSGNSGHTSHAAHSGYSGYDGHGWEPTPQGGEYDSDATAFVHLSPEDLAAVPLAAPGHGFVPPMIYPLTPAAEPAQWPVPPEAEPSGAAVPPPLPLPPHVSPPAPAPLPTPVADTDPHATAQWNFHDAVGTHPAEDAGSAGTVSGGAVAGGTASADLTGQWTIPLADGDLSDESGEFTTASLGYGSAPATLPGGAPAPWAAALDVPKSPEAPESPEAVEVTPEVPEAPEAPESGAAEPVSDGPTAEVSPAGPEGDAPVGTAEEDGPAAAEDASGAVGTDVPGAEASVAVVSDAVVSDAVVPGAVVPDADASGAAAVAEGAPDAAAPAEAPADGSGAVGLVPEARTGDVLPDTGAEPDVPTDVDPGQGEPAPAEPVPAEPAFVTPFSDHPGASYVLRVNGTDRPVTDAWIGESLLYVLRERLGLAGAKDGCAQGECGACNVQVDGRLVASCLVPAATAAGSEVRTVEGLAADGEPSDVQRALAKCGAVQCGFCVPGMAMTVHDLLEGNHAPTELETRQALCGNLCRCSGYRGVLEAVREVVAEREAHAGAAAEEARIPHQAAPGAGSVQQPHPHDGGMA
ncbi:2Fe-2S iron-sulfur cluster-binding protein [Streptomyces sp. NPDC050504]|uniref:2Fe-2S iron-sulfur cluster-binding protein n=1 Tax=Streptomyces sp. NPDC050504 TaxID=3365618 RepID=UPI0037A70F55